MAYLTAAVVAVVLLCLFDLVLSVGIIRRLREHTTQLERGLSAGSAEPPGVPVGNMVPAFTATTTDGDSISRGALAGRTLVGFFAPGCQPCAEQLPKFIEHARSIPGERPLAVVVGGDAGNAEDAEYVARLAPVARVVVEAPDGPVQQAFQVSGYPMLYLLDSGGVVAARGPSTELLDQLSPPSVTEPATV